MSNHPQSSSPDPPTNANSHLSPDSPATSASASASTSGSLRSQRPRNWGASSASNGRTLTPISTSSKPTTTTASTTSTTTTSSSSNNNNHQSPKRSHFSSPTGLSFNSASAAASRHVTSRQSSTSSTHSSSLLPHVSQPASLHATTATTTTVYSSTGRSRNPVAAAADSPRLAASLASSSSVGASAGAGSSRLSRQSPSLSLTTASAGSPLVSAFPHTITPSGQLSSLVITQLNILLSSIKDIKSDSDRVKWETQAEKIRNLVHASGMELFTTYFRRLLQSNASAIFPGVPRAPSSTGDNAGSYQLLVEEVQKILKDPQQADKMAQSLDTNEGDLFRDFDLMTFLDHFRLDSIAKVALALPCRAASKAELRSKADTIVLTNFQQFLHSLSSPKSIDADADLTPPVLAAIIERLIQNPPRNWGEEQRENLFYAIRVRYNALQSRIPAVVESAMLLEELLASAQDSRLVSKIQQAGPHATSSLEACKEVLAAAETRDFSYPQIANVLLYMVIAQNGDAYNPALFVNAVRQHKAGARIDWTDVVSGFDKENLRVNKKQFLALYHALLPLARDYANFDIQSLWGGQWNFQETHLSFVVAFLSTKPEELDVMQIPNLRQAFDLTNFATASDSIRNFAEQAIKHPLVSMDATQALFTMIFKSQETYNMAQMLGIPDTVINQNMTIFVCAASAVPKPWAPLQEQALKQLFYPFLLKQHDNFDFVMHALWQHDKSWVATRMVEFYQQEQMLLPSIYEHALEHGWLELLFTIQSSFSVDLATYAHGKGHCNLEEWAQAHIGTMGPTPFARAIHDFLRAKCDDEGIVQREHVGPTTPPLTVKTVHALLMLLVEAAPDENFGPLYRQCLQLYPRLFNYGEDDARNEIIDANGERSNVLPESATRDMEERYKLMYGGQTNPDHLVNELNRLKVSEEPADQELFAAMLFGLFEEYNCFGEYPNEALATTAVLFGGLVSYHVLSGIAEQAAIFMIFEAVSEYGPEDPMYRFGLQALLHVLPRLKEWPQLAERILHAPSLRGTAAIPAAENALKELQQENAALNGDGPNGIANGVIDEDFPVEAAPAFTAIQVDPPLGDTYEEPNEDVSDKVMFVLNNVSKRNLDEKFKEIEGALEEKYHQWFAHYLVEELAKSQPNFQSLYLQILENFNKKMLWAEVLRETYMSCQKMLNAQSTMDNQHERATLKNLAGWLGSITLARNQPILHRNLSFKDLLVEGHDNGRLIVAIPFTCKTLVQVANSKVFKPPNPWIVELLGVLSELYHCMDLKLNMKFEIEMLCRELGQDIKAIEPLDVIRSRPVIDQAMLQNYIPEGPDAFGETALMGLSKRGPNERFSPEAVIAAVPDLGGMLQIPQAVGNITSQQMRSIFVNAAQQAIYEIIAPVVERSVTIASISTAELIQKDFVTEGDENKVRNSAHTVVKALSGSLALVTCKEPLRMSITNNIRILASRNLPEQLPEGQILMFVNDNIDTVCRLVEQAAEDHSLAEIDLQLQQAIDERRQHNEQRPNEPFSQTPVSRWSTLIPEPYRQDQNGLNRQQLALYEEFGRQARIPAATHINQTSQDGQRALPDVLGEGYLPSLPTPAEVPAMPRAQGGRLPMQAGHPAHVNGFVDATNIGERIVAMMQELQHASREATEEHVGEVGEGAPIRRIYGQLLGLIESAPQMESTVLASAHHCLAIIYGEPQKRLEVEVFVRLLTQLCRLSPPACRAITMSIATAEEDRIFSPWATIALQAEGLIDIPHIDSLISKGLHARRHIALGFFRDVLEELLLNEHATALRTDFILSYEALSQWLHEENDLDTARDIMAKLQTPASHINGMPSPESETTKQDQNEYIFEEWIKLQRKDVPHRACLGMISQLHDKGVLSGPDSTLLFIRTCLEYSCSAFERISNTPYGTQDQAYIAIDALAKMIATLILYQSPVDAEPPANKVKSFEAFIRLVILVLMDTHNKQRERWNGRVYFRFFSTLLCEFHCGRDLLTPEQDQDLYKSFATALLVLQPKYLPGFAFHWLGLLSHRLLLPSYLVPAGRTNGGWNTFTKLLITLFSSLGEMMAIPEAPAYAQDYYRSVLRFFTMLHHDCPEYLVENHMQLNASIPSQCFQLHNIINSAATRSVYPDQPDPFTPGLKINRLEHVRQAPAIHSDIDNVLDEGGIKSIMEHICTANELSDPDFATVLAVVDRQDGYVSSILVNALVLYVGVHATSASSVFSSGAAPARLLIRLLSESRAEARYWIVSAMTNQVRYVNAHTHYFSTALQHIFNLGQSGVQEQIMRVLCERLMVPRPHPWGLIVMMLEMVKNQAYNIWDLPWVKAAPQIEAMLVNLAQSQEPRLVRSPSGMM